MYRIMLADDEGIVIDSLKYIIEKNFGDNCSIKSAKTGRAVIELAEEFRPDIAIMDIQMPGINGIEAIKEIQKISPSTIFIIMSAYDKFTYAKEAINLGVLEYLTKPANQGKIVSTLEKAMKIIDHDREKRSNDLLIKEKLETVVPIIESGFIYTILLQDNYEKETKSFKELLVIEEDQGFIMVIQYGELGEKGDLLNPVGVSVKAQTFYVELREIVKEFFKGIVGSVMVNQVVVFIPWKKRDMEYNERIEIIEKARNLVRKLIRRIDLNFKAGIGSVKPLSELMVSYKEAVSAIRQNKGKVVHINDIKSVSEYEKDYVGQMETVLFQLVKAGDIANARGEADTYFDWIVENGEKYEIDIKTKLFELILRIETEIFSCGVTAYHSRFNHKSFKMITDCKNDEEFKKWFVDKITEMCTNVIVYREKQSDGVISRAKNYILEHYMKEISLDDVSREVDISPYYFSKLFKEETGENFIEYLSSIRIEKSKRLLINRKLSIKEICMEVGYGDPNYFSRIFKKHTGKTPSEYREGQI